MPDVTTKKFAIAHVGPRGRVALCEVLSDVIEADTWKEAIKKVDRKGLVDRPGYGAEISETLDA